MYGELLEFHKATSVPDSTFFVFQSRERLVEQFLQVAVELYTHVFGIAFGYPDRFLSLELLYGHYLCLSSVLFRSLRVYHAEPAFLVFAYHESLCISLYRKKILNLYIEPDVCFDVVRVDFKQILGVFPRSDTFCRKCN